MAAISTLADQVQDRLEEPAGTAGIFWLRGPEIYSGLVEAMNEMMMLVGRPTQVVSVPFTLQPNSVWQTVPKGMLCITNIQGGPSEVWKVTLQDLDYLQASWGPDWEQDLGDAPMRWAPIGFNKFVIHPAIEEEQVVLITGISYPSTSTWPYDGNQTVPFSDEFFVALEEYAAHYARFKEQGNEFSESFKLLQSFNQLAQVMTQIQDRRDPYIFSRATGAPMQVNPIAAR